MERCYYTNANVFALSQSGLLFRVSHFNRISARQLVKQNKNRGVFFEWNTMVRPRFGDIGWMTSGETLRYADTPTPLFVIYYPAGTNRVKFQIYKAKIWVISMHSSNNCNIRISWEEHNSLTYTWENISRRFSCVCGHTNSLLLHRTFDQCSINVQSPSSFFTTVSRALP